MCRRVCCHPKPLRSPMMDDLTRRAEDQDLAFMAEAVGLARSTVHRTWPNPPVGALVVKGGKVAGRGRHEGPGQSHAETVALAEAGEAARGATLYVTLEPCNHQGRTPPCAPAVLEAGIRRLVVAMRDPNPDVKGGGCRWLRERGLRVECGVGAAEALELVWPFAATDNFRRPWVLLKTATSLDGRFAPTPVADAVPGPVYLTGEPARRHVHRWRRRVDLVLVGEGTVRADRPRLDGRLVADDAGVEQIDPVPQADPVPGYVDTDLSWDGGLAAPHYLVFAGQEAAGTGVERVRSDGGEIVPCATAGGHVDPAALLDTLAGRGIHTVMIEGGPRLAASFLAAGLVDRWLRYEAPVVLGSGVDWPDAFPPAAQVDPVFSLTRSERVGDDMLTVLDRQDFTAMLAKVTI